jgi:hypothetical protein
LEKPSDGNEIEAVQKAKGFYKACMNTGELIQYLIDFLYNIKLYSFVSLAMLIVVLFKVK